jgi:uncharacterized membrane protein
MVLGIAAILVVIIITILVTTGVIEERYYPYCIGLMALGLVYSTTMLGGYVVGSDIQGELYQSRQTLANGWDFAHAESFSLVTIVFAPFLSQLFHIDIVWIYKAVLPLFLAGVPFILYFVFKKLTDSKRAFFTALFFIIMPVYSLEIAQIGKSMVAEFFYALVILAMVSDWELKEIVMIICGVLVVLCHYTIGVIMIGTVAGILVVRFITNWGRWFINRKVTLAWLLIFLVLYTGWFYAFYSYVGDGAISDTIGKVINNYTNIAADIVNHTITNQPQYIYIPAHLTQLGMGADFFTQPIEGQIFRVIQYLTQLLIVIGGVSLLFRPGKFTAEFIIGVGCSFFLLLCCVVIVPFSKLINMSRFYQLSLFFLAPLLVVGIDTIARRRE